MLPFVTCPVRAPPFPWPSAGHIRITLLLVRLPLSIFASGFRLLCLAVFFQLPSSFGLRAFFKWLILSRSGGSFASLPLLSVLFWFRSFHSFLPPVLTVLLPGCIFSWLFRPVFTRPVGLVPLVRLFCTPSFPCRIYPSSM